MNDAHISGCEIVRCRFYRNNKCTYYKKYCLYNPIPIADKMEKLSKRLDKLEKLIKKEK